MKKIAFALAALSVLVGCDEVKTKLNIQPNQNEQECLNSERLKFKDPEVLFVANLGSRGLPAVPDQYWVRYKAKNSYGAYIQGNMLCKLDKVSGKWVRNLNDELILEMNVTADLLEAINEKMQNDPVFLKNYSPSQADPSRLQEEARNILFTSPDNLSKHVESPSKQK